VTQTAGVMTRTSALPTMPFGQYTLSRLICGANPFNAGSHLSVFVNEDMRRHYGVEQVLRTLRRCEELGVNCWQSAGGNFAWYRRFREEGGTLHYLTLGESYYPNGTPPLAELAAGGCIGVAHHGEVTDTFFKQGQFEKVGDYLKQVRDAGMMAGVSTHMPAVVDAVESKSWPVDFYMACVYERHRTAEELRALLGHVPLPVGEVYLQSDPPRMYAAIRRTRRPCLAFKILAAGRLCERKQFVEDAFRETFAGIKPTDGVIVGIFDRYSDQVMEDVALTRRFGAAQG
jgi:hypothetical protein